MRAVLEGKGHLYIKRSYRKDGKSTSEIFKKLGNIDDLCSTMNMSRDQVMSWAKKEAQKLTEQYNNDHAIINVTFDPDKVIEANKERSFNCGYLFLVKILYDLKINKISRYIKDHHLFEYDINRIIIDLVSSRIIDPTSKRSTYEFAKTLLSEPNYELHDLYRSLSILAQYSDYIQNELYCNSNYIVPRDTSVLYYDCTNYYFEIEDEKEMRKYGKSKEHRPNPIETMGLFIDSNGIPLAFDIYEGNKHETKTLKPLERKILNDFNLSEFIFCSDSALGSKDNRKFNSIQKRHYVITQSLKKLKEEIKDTIFDTRYYKKLGSNYYTDLKDLDETDNEVYNSVYYKEIPLSDKDSLIVTYSIKYKNYQRKIREKQILRAKEMISKKGKIKKNKNPNDPSRFIKKCDVDQQGELIDKEYYYYLDEDKIKEEAKYDGFYGVATDLDDVYKVIRINKGRWQIEECFRIMKTEFEGRPVYVSREDRIKAHFLICFIALLVYRLLEKKLGDHYTCHDITSTLKSMNLTKIKESYYIPSYKRTALSDDLHNKFGFRLDYEIIRKSTIRSIIKNIKNS